MCVNVKYELLLIFTKGLDLKKIYLRSFLSSYSKAAIASLLIVLSLFHWSHNCVKEIYLAFFYLVPKLQSQVFWSFSHFRIDHLIAVTTVLKWDHFQEHSNGTSKLYRRADTRRRTCLSGIGIGLGLMYSTPVSKDRHYVVSVSPIHITWSFGRQRASKNVGEEEKPGAGGRWWITRRYVHYICGSFIEFFKTYWCPDQLIHFGFPFCDQPSFGVVLSWSSTATNSCGVVLNWKAMT